MNREFEITQLRGTLLIVVAFAGLALLILALQMVGSADLAEVPGVQPGNAGQQVEQVVESAAAIVAEAPAVALRGWKAEEIGASSPVTGRASMPFAGEQDDALSLGRAFAAAEAAAVEPAPVERGWKAEEIEAAAGAAAPAPAEGDDALSLGSFYHPVVTGYGSPVERGWKADEIGAAGATKGVSAEQEDALSLGRIFGATGERAESRRQGQIQAMATKLDSMAADEGRIPAGYAGTESCSPAVGFGPEDC